MLQTIREHTQGWISGIIIGVIIISFSLWGIHSYFTGSTQTDDVAEVNGVAISKQRLSIAYDRLRKQILSQYGVGAIQNEALLRKQALQSLVGFEVLKQGALKEGFRVFNPQIERYLQNMSDFQVDGQFSLDRFQQLLMANSLSEADFFEIVRANLLVEQPQAGILLSSFALPNEAKAVAALVNQERDIDYLVIPNSYFTAKPMTVSADDIRIYYNQHLQDFLKPEKVSIDYIELSVKELAAKHQEDKFSEKREQLANITYEHPETLKDAAQALGLPIQSTDLFAKEGHAQGIAQYTQVRQAAFSGDVLEGQNNSDLIQIAPDHVIVLRVRTHEAAASLPLSDVSATVENKIKSMKAETQANDLARQLQDQLNAGVKPASLAEQYHVNWNHAGFLGRYSNKVGTGTLDLAFRLPDPALNHLQASYGYTRTADGFVVVGVKAVRAGELKEKDSAVFTEQVQNSEGVLEYELYKQSQIEHAKIKYVGQK